MSLAEKRERSALAVEIGDMLKTMAGQRDGGEHKSLGFHRRLAFLMPEEFVREALRATRDAVEEHRAGRKTLHGGPSAYFAGIAIQVAEREGIELGLRRKGGTPRPTAQPCAHGAMEPWVLPARVDQGESSDKERVEARSALARLRESLESGTPSLSAAASAKS
jgi:hypothetical protein